MSDPATIFTAAPLSADPLLSAAEELSAAANAKVRQFTSALQKEDLKILTDRAVREASDRWREISDHAAVFIRESPGRAALAALGIGFALGLLFRRD